MNEKHLYIIDGHAIIYRAYYATLKNRLTDNNGRPTGAVYAFATYLLRLITTYKCPYIAVIFDSPVPTFRHEMYHLYKANRDEMPDDLKLQIPLIFRLVEALNLPMLRRDGLEADDIIASMTHRAVELGFKVSLVTRDKDLMQLVNGSVNLLAPADGGTLENMGREEVIAKMGVPPEKIRDLLALMGDSSDNVPGLDGVGPKTAIKILEKAGSVEALLANPACVENEKLRAKIESSREVLELSKRLVTLKDDVDLGLQIADLSAREIDREKAAAFFKELSFESLLRSANFETRTTLDFSVRTAATIDQVVQFVKQIRATGHVCVDTETTSTTPREAKLVGISMAMDQTQAIYIPVGHNSGANLDLDEVISAIRDVLEDPAVAKIGQNLKYDYQVFKNYGIILRGISFDSMIAAYLFDSGRRQYSLDSLATQLLNVKTTPIESLIGKKGKDQKTFAEVSIEDAARYSGEDVILPLRLKKILEPALIERDQLKLFNEIEIPLVSVLAEIEWQGLALDSELLRSLSVDYTQSLAQISQRIFALAGEEFNLNSPKQISELFFGKLGMPKSKKTKTGLSTDVDALEKLAPDYPIASILLEYRETQKLLSTYIDALPQQVSSVSGRLHTTLHQTVTTTGRLSSADPNLQNIPIRTDNGRRIREAFVAPPGKVLVAADYSQIELRILAHLSQDPTLCDAFAHDADIHTQTAAAMYNCFAEMVTPQMRRAAKTINFGLMYGMGPHNLSRQIGVSFKEAQSFIDKYFEQFPRIRLLMDNNIALARDNGYAQTMLGRRRYLPDLSIDNRMAREAAERAAINMPVQGTAADIIKIAMIDISRTIGNEFPDTIMLLQVHDELIFEAPTEQAKDLGSWASERMGAALKLDVPLKVDVGIGPNWSSAH